MEDAFTALGRRKQERQSEFWVATQNLPCSPGHPFHEQLNEILDVAGFDRFCEEICRPFYAEKMGRPRIPPGVYFRMRMVGYFEKLDSEWQIAWRCSDSLSLRSFLGLKPEANSPDDSSLNRTRLRVDVETRRPKLASITGGLSGPAIRPVALAMVWKVASRLNIPVVGVGGIFSYRDALEFLIAGATAVEVGTANFVNPTASVEIAEGISSYLEGRGYGSVREVIGSLEAGE